MHRTKVFPLLKCFNAKAHEVGNWMGNGTVSEIPRVIWIPSNENIATIDKLKAVANFASLH